MRKRKIDKKAVAIIILSAVVLVEAFFLLVYKSKQVASVKAKKEAVTLKKEAVKKPTIAPPKVAEKKAPAAVVKKPFQGKIAIIIDDCGYNLQPCTYSAAIKNPVTFSVLPDLRHSTDVAECVHANRQSVMLHLPMEPHYNADHYPDDYIITTEMKKSKVESIIEKDLENVPYAEGINNHMGSKATESIPLMTVIFAKLKAQGLFFIDSLVTEKSVCSALAKTSQLPFAQRDVFLDNVNEREYIEGQFAHLAEVARTKGYAIAIGHDRKLTLDIIKEQTELLESQGFQFVAAKDLLLKK